MVSKLSINAIGVNQGLAQIKTDEMFQVVAIDLDAKKVTLKSAAGEEKVVSKATLERWYRELSAEEVVAFGKTMNTDSDGGSQDEVQEQDESAQVEAPEASENDADGTDVEETATEADAGKEDDVVAKLKAMYGKPSNRTDGTRDGGDAGEHDNVRGQADRGVEDVDGHDTESIGNDEGNGTGSTEEADGDGEEVASPVTPSNAGKDKDKAKEQKRQEPKNAALMKVRQTIIDTILADSPSIQLRKTTSYDVFKEKHNFAEITHGSNRFNVSVMSKCLTEDQLNKVKVNPASFGWSIDADFTVFDETDIEMAVKLIRQSREYRLANPVTRKKKEKK